MAIWAVTHMVQMLCRSMAHGIARSFVWRSKALSVLAVCALRPSLDGMAKGEGFMKDCVFISPCMYGSEEHGRCMVDIVLCASA